MRADRFDGAPEIVCEYTYRVGLDGTAYDERDGGHWATPGAQGAHEERIGFVEGLDHAECIAETAPADAVGAWFR
ncbi:MAG: hypothetical protein IPM54_12660 [Polyangiaceae bacterium]|nr:hypothetical protein [Polyangiaceae bacterium]